MSLDLTSTQDRLLTLNIKDGEVLNTLPGVHVTPMYLDREKGIWVLYARFEPGTRLPRHYHSGVVHFFTTKGSWAYVEHPEDVQTEGSYLFEPAGSHHTFEFEGRDRRFHAGRGRECEPERGWLADVHHGRRLDRGRGQAGRPGNRPDRAALHPPGRRQSRLRSVLTHKPARQNTSFRRAGFYGSRIPLPPLRPRSDSPPYRHPAL